jgi:penicillin-binding protein 1A
VHPLGNGETGGRAALPIWIDYMGKALDGVPESSLAQPPGLVTVRIDPRTGMRLPSGQSGGIFEVFLPDHIPEQFSEPAYQHSEAAEVAEPLF